MRGEKQNFTVSKYLSPKNILNTKTESNFTTEKPSRRHLNKAIKVNANKLEKSPTCAPHTPQHQWDALSRTQHHFCDFPPIGRKYQTNLN